MEALMQDLRYGIRMLAQKPGFTMIAVIALALGIGANTAIFSVVNGVLLRPLPYADPDRLMTVYETNYTRGYDDGGTSPPDFRAWRDRNQAFEQMAAFNLASFNLTGVAEPERVLGAVVSHNLFSVLGISPAQGRGFLADEEKWGQHRAVALSHGLWQRRFAADPDIVGKAIDINGEKYAVVAVMPPDFLFPDRRAALWVPMSFEPDSVLNTRGNHYLGVLARLNPGVTMEQAQAEMNNISRQLEQEFKENDGMGSRVSPLREETVGEIRPALLVLLAAVGFVLLIACANVANLLLARAATRQKEIAIRVSLGATRARVIRQLLTESVVLGALGGALGLLLALWGVDVLVSLGPTDLPRLDEISVDGGVLGFTFGLSLLTGVFFGLAPAIQASKPDLNESLKEGSRGSTRGVSSRRVRSLLVVTEVALSLVLLIGAGLLIRSFLRLQSVDPGFRPDRVLTMLVTLPRTKYPDAQFQRREVFFNQLIERIRGLPGVEGVGATTSLPLGQEGGWGKLFSVEGHPSAASLEEVPGVQYRQVTPDYLSTMRIPLLKGRFFTERDNRDSQRVAIINETLARRFFPDEDPIGKRVWLGPPEHLVAPLPEGFEYPRLTIIGVVKDVKHTGLGRQANPEIFGPHPQGYRSETSRSMFLAVRAASDPSGLVTAVRNEVWAMDKDQPIANIATMEERLSDSLSRQRFNMLLLGIFAAVALLLATVGIYGVMSYAVSQRTHEIGIRMALGARSEDVLRLVLGQGMKLSLIGVGIGLAASFGLTRLMSSLLYEVSATDPVTFVLISLLLGGVALLACVIPARRAMKVDPMVALRYE